MNDFEESIFERDQTERLMDWIGVIRGSVMIIRECTGQVDGSIGFRMERQKKCQARAPLRVKNIIILGMRVRGAGGKSGRSLLRIVRPIV